MSLLFGDQVELVCTANVGDEKLFARQSIPAIVYDDPEARKVIEAALRQRLMLAVLEKWTPVIKVRRS